MVLVVMVLAVMVSVVIGLGPLLHLCCDPTGCGPVVVDFERVFGIVAEQVFGRQVEHMFGSRISDGYHPGRTEEE